MSTLERLAALLQQKFNVDAGRISMERPLEQLGIDSLGLVELLFLIEEEFQVQMPQDPPPLSTVGDAVGYIEQLLAAQRPSDAPLPERPVSVSPTGPERPAPSHPDLPLE